MDLYQQMGEELRSLFRDLFDPKKQSAVEKKMARIISAARKMSPELQKEAEQLFADVAEFLKDATPKALPP